METKRKIAVTYSDIMDRHMAQIRTAAEGFEVVSEEGIGDCEIIFGQANAKQLASAKQLKWLHAQSAGVDHYLKMGLSDGVILTNSAGMHSISIAEHMMGFTLMLMRRLHSYAIQQPQHTWDYLGPVKSVYRSVICVVGLGGIGSYYAASCRALGAVVRGVVRSPRKTAPGCVDELFTIDRLDEAIKDADVVALVLPDTKETVRLFDRERMLKMKKGAIILNVGRGSAIAQDAMTELLESGHLGGAGLDVTEPEPLPADSKLWDAPNVILTPHISGGGLELTVDLIVERFIKYLKDYMAGRPFERVVDRKAGY